MTELTQESIFPQWEDVYAALKKEAGDSFAIRWLSKIVPGKIEGDGVFLYVPSLCIQELVEQKFSQKILSLFKQKNPALNFVRFDLQPTAQPAQPAPAPMIEEFDIANADMYALGPKSLNKLEPNQPFSTFLNPHYTFESFVVGKPNEFAFAAARRVAENDTIQFNPLCIHGAPGLGKTHLMQGIAWKIKDRFPYKNVLYLSSEQFVNYFINALKSHETNEFKDIFRSVDVLLVDDIQFICGKKSSQEEFFHTFNVLIGQGKQIILSSDVPPAELEGIEERLKTRLVQGLVVDIHPTSYELRLGILEGKCQMMNVAVPYPVLELLARKISANVRELEGALKRIVAYAELIGTPITTEMASRILADTLNSARADVNIPAIQKQVADFYAIKLAELKSTRRDRKIARPRQIAMYLAKQLTTLSLPEIATQFERDHTTVMHAVKTITSLKVDDKELAHELDIITNRLTQVGE